MYLLGYTISVISKSFTRQMGIKDSLEDQNSEEQGH